MARKKTTVYIDEGLFQAVKVSAARTGKREYQIFEEALRNHLGLAAVVEQIWSGISPDQAPSEDEAASIAAAEISAARTERAAPKAG